MLAFFLQTISEPQVWPMELMEVLSSRHPGMKDLFLDNKQHLKFVLYFPIRGYCRHIT